MVKLQLNLNHVRDTKLKEMEQWLQIAPHEFRDGWVVKDGLFVILRRANTITEKKMKKLNSTEENEIICKTLGKRIGINIDDGDGGWGGRQKALFVQN